MSIKYYHLAKDEELPDEFCAVRDVGGEPSEYTFYVPESEVAKLREEIEAAKHDLQVFSIRSVQLDAENAKLRELCRRYGEYVSQDRCEGCVCKTRCNNGLIDECWQRGEIRDLARELGVEVDG